MDFTTFEKLKLVLALDVQQFDHDLRNFLMPCNAVVSLQVFGYPYGISRPTEMGVGSNSV